MADGWVQGQSAVHLRRVRLSVLARFIHTKPTLAVVAHRNHASTVNAIDDDQNFAIPRNERVQHGLHCQGAASRHRHRDMRIPASDKGHQFLANPLIKPDELTIPRPPVPQHGTFRFGRRHERARGQQERNGCAHQVSFCCVSGLEIALRGKPGAVRALRTSRSDCCRGARKRGGGVPGEALTGSSGHVGFSRAVAA
jgi:hypothetical protein